MILFEVANKVMGHERYFSFFHVRRSILNVKQEVDLVYRGILLSIYPSSLFVDTLPPNPCLSSGDVCGANPLIPIYASGAE
jgi:hypothetical protein